MGPPAEISVASPLGITLIGLSVGDRMAVIESDVREPPWVDVLAVGVRPLAGSHAGRPSRKLSNAVVGGSPWIA